MSTFKNHRGELNKTNIGLAICTGFVIAAICTTISMPHWSAIPSILAPLATFAATPLGIGILVGFGLFLVCSMIYGIMQKNKISEMEAPKLVVSAIEGNNEMSNVSLKVTKEDYEYIKTNHQSEDYEGLYSIDSELKGQRLNILCQKCSDDGNHCYLRIHAMTLTKDNQSKDLMLQNEIAKGIVVTTPDKEALSKSLGLGTGKKDARELSITLLPSTEVENPKAAAQGKEKGKEK